MRHWCAVLVIVVIVHTSYQNEGGRIVCYYRSDNIYRGEGFRMQAHEVDPYLCTHVIYFAANLHPDEAIASSDTYIDIARGGYKMIVKLKEKNPNLKVMLALRNDPNHIDYWPHISNHKLIRHWFSKRVINYLRTYNFDGLDIVWQVPNDKMKPDKYLRLLQSMREEMDLESETFGQKRLELSIFLPAQIQQLHKHFQLANASKLVDFINVASMDYWALNPYTVQHHAPLFMNQTEGSFSPINVDESIKYYLFKCVPPEKIVLGVPTYGRSFKLSNRKINNIGSDCIYPGEKGFATSMPGTLAYFEICTYIKEDLWSVGNVNLTSMGPYAYFDDRWVGYDDIAIISKKAKYAREQGLGGLMFWTIDQDDFRCYCKTRFPLIRAGKFTLQTGIEISDEDVLRDEEENISMFGEGYVYPKPTITQPGLPWGESTTAPTYHISSSKDPSSNNIKPTTYKPDVNSSDGNTNVDKNIDFETQATNDKPLVESTTETVFTTLKPHVNNNHKTSKPIISNLNVEQENKKSPSSSEYFGENSRNPSLFQSGDLSPSLDQNIKPLKSSSSKETGQTSGPPDNTGHSAAEASGSGLSPPPETPSEYGQSSTNPFSSVTTPTIPSSTTGFPPQPPELDSDDNHATNAINRLNNVLDTVNQVISNINEVNAASGQFPSQNNITIDPSFLQILQPLLNLRKSTEYSVDMSRPGKPANTTVKVDSDVSRIRGNNTSGINIPLEQILPLLRNMTKDVNSNNSQYSLPLDILGDKNLVISGRDIVTIRLNITINNNYFNTNDNN